MESFFSMGESSSTWTFMTGLARLARRARGARRRRVETGVEVCALEGRAFRR